MSLMGLFSSEACYGWVDAKGDSLIKLNQLIDWEGLRKKIGAITFENVRGRPALDALMMVKVILLQALYNIADDACEYQINDRLSFKRFLGLSMDEKAPDAKSIWLYRERIKHGRLDEVIFAWFDAQLIKAGYIAQKGQIVDATFVPTHKPTGKQDKQLKAGIPLTPAQMAQRDEDATFTKKGDATYHGYKDHIQVDVKHKLIRKHSQTTASTHDSQEIEQVLDTTLNTGRGVWADSAYRSAAIEQTLSTHRLRSQIHYKGYRNNPLSSTKKRTNKTRSSIRSRVEHVFGYMETVLGGMMIHTIGLARAKVKITFKNLAYNMRRFTFLQSQHA